MAAEGSDESKKKQKNELKQKSCMLEENQIPG